MSGPVNGFITVGDYTTLWDTPISLSVLEIEGIHAMILDEYATGIHWTYSFPAGGVRLKVMESDARRAVAILENARIEKTQLQQGHLTLDQALISCPVYGSGQLAWLEPPLLFVLLFIQLLGLPLLFHSSRHVFRAASGMEYKGQQGRTFGTCALLKIV